MILDQQANVDFLKKNPKVEKLLKVASIPLADISAQNMKMNKGEKSERDVKRHAKEWVKANKSTFDGWIKKLNNFGLLNPSKYAYLPIAEWIEKYVKEWLFEQRPLFKKISVPIDNVLNSLDFFFNFVPLPIVIIFFTFAAYKTNSLKFAIFTFLSLIFIDLLDIWEETMTTMAMIITAVIFCCFIGIPLGILSSRSNFFEASPDQL